MKAPIAIDRRKIAAVFVDLQEEHRQDSRYLVDRFDAILANVRMIQEAARRNGVMLYHFAYVVDPTDANDTFHPKMPDGTAIFSNNGHPWTEVCPEVAPTKGERLLTKTEASAFGAASPAGELRQRGVEWVLVAGVWTEACIDATVKDAIRAGFRVLLVKDACGSGTQAMHETAMLNLANRLYGGAVTDTIGACRLLDGSAVNVWMVEGSTPLRFTYHNASTLFAEL
ncbi:isochorismatase family protein [Nitratireductor sp. ZSWI3]|uniref:isochorismatase family protein n=1 Tax=Nitratireductor sp. ZSWI3 TaxID=2966359 RepID=UPI0021504060|nr:isochorismatase family protein [Nitratireductor sp. ZSWI3]MCR4265048.1 isochorismatase family protein [Nitratireductor sp. ZSWI3]